MVARGGCLDASIEHIWGSQWEGSRVTDMSDNAKKLLKHFQDSKIPQGDFEYSAKLEELFEKVEDCEKAQAELAALGVLELLPLPPSRTALSRVSSATLTLDGTRYLKK